MLCFIKFEQPPSLFSLQNGVWKPLVALQTLQAFHAQILIKDWENFMLRLLQNQIKAGLIKWQLNRQRNTRKTLSNLSVPQLTVIFRTW